MSRLVDSYTRGLEHMYKSIFFSKFITQEVLFSQNSKEMYD